MDDLLNQSDIDALLNAAVVGQETEEETGPQIFSRFRHDFDDIEIKDYDFKRPERISKDHMTALQTLHETFARNFGASMSGFLRTIVEVRVAHAEQMTYAEFIASLPNPTSFNLIESPDLDGQMCMELSPLIIYPIIDRLLGGSNKDLFIPHRSMTMIETRLIQAILDRAMNALSEAWESVREMRFELGEMESNPHIVQIVPPNEVVVVIGFEIKMTNRAGTMTLCIPFKLIESLIEELSAQSWFHHGEASAGDRFREQIRDRIAEAPLKLRGVLAETTMTIKELRQLEVGDILMTDRSATAPVLITAEEKPKLIGHIGQCRGRRAIRILRPILPTDRF